MRTLIIGLAMLSAALAGKQSVLRWFHVSTAGNDAADGSETTPFATIARAQGAARRFGKGAGVQIGPGRFELNETLQFDQRDAGTTYAGAGANRTFVTGGRLIQSEWRPSSLVRGAWETDLFATVSPSAVGEQCSGTSARMNVYFRDTPQWRARWPNRPASPAGFNMSRIRSTSGFGKKYFCYSFDNKTDPDPESGDRWASVPDNSPGYNLCWHGDFTFNWRDEWSRFQHVSLSSHCAFSPDTVAPRAGVAEGGGYYGEGWIGDLDAPGEWALNVSNGLLTLIPLQQPYEGVLPADEPPTPLNDPTLAPAPGEVTVSLLASLVNVTVGADNLAVANLTLEHAQADAVSVAQTDGVSFRGVTVRNANGWGITTNDTTHLLVSGSNFTSLGGGGVQLSGGDTASLTAGGSVVENSRFWRWATVSYNYNSAVGLRGVGNTVRKCEAYDSPHVFSSFGGNNHLIELNDVHHVLRMAYDSGAVYADRNPTFRGNVIRHNRFVSLGNLSSGTPLPCLGKTSCIEMAVYVDDFMSGVTVQGNIIAGVQTGFFSHHGRNHTLLNNLFLNTSIPVTFAGAFNWGNYNDTFRQEIAALPTETPPWSVEYPDLATIFDCDDNRNCNPGLPRRVSLVRIASANLLPLNPWMKSRSNGWNITQQGFWGVTSGMTETKYCDGCVSGWGTTASCQGCFTTANNTAKETPSGLGLAHPDPLAVLNFTLAPDSPLWALGWQRIPEEEIGPN